MNKIWSTPTIEELDILTTAGGGNWGGSEEETLQGVIGNPMSWYGCKDFEEYYDAQIRQHSGNLTLEEATHRYMGS